MFLKFCPVFVFLFLSLQINAQTINPIKLNTSKDSLVFYQNQISLVKKNFTREYNKKQSEIVQSRDSIIKLISSWDELYYKSKLVLDSAVSVKRSRLKDNKKLANLAMCSRLEEIQKKDDSYARMKSFFVTDKRSLKRLSEITGCLSPIVFISMGSIEKISNPFYKCCYIISFDLDDESIFNVSTFVVNYKKNSDTQLLLYSEIGNVDEFKIIENIEKKYALETITIKDVVFDANNHSQVEYTLNEDRHILEMFNIYPGNKSPSENRKEGYEDLGLTLSYSTSAFIEIYGAKDIFVELLMVEVYENLLNSAKMFTQSRVSDLQLLLKQLDVNDFRAKRNLDSIKVDMAWNYYNIDYPALLSKYNNDYEKALIEDKKSEEKYQQDLKIWESKIPEITEKRVEIAATYLKSKLLDPFSIKELSVSRIDNKELLLDCECMEVFITQFYEKNRYGAYEGKSTYIIVMLNDLVVGFEKLENVNQYTIPLIAMNSQVMLGFVTWKANPSICSEGLSKPIKFESSTKLLEKPKLKEIDNLIKLSYTNKIVDSGKILNSPFEHLGVNDFHRNYLMRCFLFWYQKAYDRTNLIKDYKCNFDFKDIDSWIFSEFTDNKGDKYWAWQDKMLNEFATRMYDPSLKLCWDGYSFSRDDCEGKSNFDVWKRIPLINTKYSNRNKEKKFTAFENFPFSISADCEGVFPKDGGTNSPWYGITSCFWRPDYDKVDYYFAPYLQHSTYGTGWRIIGETKLLE